MLVLHIARTKKQARSGLSSAAEETQQSGCRRAQGRRIGSYGHYYRRLQKLICERAASRDGRLDGGLMPRRWISRMLPQAPPTPLHRAIYGSFSR